MNVFDFEGNNVESWFLKKSDDFVIVHADDTALLTLNLRKRNLSLNEKGLPERQYHFCQQELNITSAVLTPIGLALQGLERKTGKHKLLLYSID